MLDRVFDCYEPFFGGGSGMGVVGIDGLGVLNAITLPIAIVGNDYNLIWTNKAMLREMGRELSDIAGRPCFEVNGSKAPLDTCPHKKFLSNVHAVTYDLSDSCLVPQTGVMISPFYNENGVFIGGVHLYFDCGSLAYPAYVKPGKGEFAGIIFENAPLAMALVKDRNILLANRRFEELFGYTYDEIKGKDTSVFFQSEEDFKRFGEVIYTKFRQEGPVITEQLMRRRSGRLFWCRFLGQSAGRGETVWILEDISLQKEIEVELAKNEEKFRAISCMASDAIVLMDMAGRVTYWNSTAQRLFGYSSREALGNDLHLLVLPDEQISAYRKAYRKFSETGKSKFEGRLVEFAARRKDGQRLFVEVSFSSVKIGGEPFFLGIIRNITKKKEEEERKKRLDVKLGQVQRLESMGILAGGVAHDFNNILMGVLGYAEIALSKLVKESPARPAIQNIIDSAQRAAELSNQMLSYTGKGVFHLETVDLSKLIEETDHLLKSMVSKKTVLKFDLNRDIPCVNIDPTQVRQVIMNLIINASEAIGERSGLITVSTGVMHADRAYLAETYLDEDLPEGFYAYIEVADTGCGMDRDVIKMIFDPFFTTKFQGRGLGLAASLGIIRAHRGAIKVYSEPGKGTTFKILFHCTKKGLYGETGTAAAPPKIAKGDKTLLVVDDDESVRTVTRMMLEESGFRVITAEDGRDAVEKFKKYYKEIDLVILDLIMPHLTGEEVYREIRRLYPNVRVILSSGYSEKDVIGKFIGKKIAGFIQKPFMGEELLEKVSKALNMS